MVILTLSDVILDVVSHYLLVMYQCQVLAMFSWYLCLISICCVFYLDYSEITLFSIVGIICDFFGTLVR